MAASASSEEARRITGAAIRVDGRLEALRQSDLTMLHRDGGGIHERGRFIDAANASSRAEQLQVEGKGTSSSSSELPGRRRIYEKANYGAPVKKAGEGSNQVSPVDSSHWSPPASVGRKYMLERINSQGCVKMLLEKRCRVQAPADSLRGLSSAHWLTPVSLLSVCRWSEKNHGARNRSRGRSRPPTCGCRGQVLPVST